MSWILNPEGDQPVLPATKPPSEDSPSDQTPPDTPTSPRPEFPLKDDYPKVPDPVDRNRMVSTKQANRPFLAYTEYRNKMQKAHDDWEERQKVRAEKVARGEEVGPEEPDPTAEREVGCLGLLKFILYTVVFITLAGKFLTGSYLWEHELPNLRNLIPMNQRLFSEQMLATFDGTVEGRPIYLAIDGDVYDVTDGRATYGPGGSYHIMWAGKDAARAFATGCFATHQTHDIRGLDEKEMDGLKHWKKFYAESNKYPKVGRVSHPPIDPMSPIPVHCNEKKAKAQREKERKEPTQPSAIHEEL